MSFCRRRQNSESAENDLIFPVRTAALWDLTHLNIVATGDDGEAAGVTFSPESVPDTNLFDVEPFTPPEMYRYMLKRVNTRIRQFFPKAEIVFATTTPVIEEDEEDDGPVFFVQERIGQNGKPFKMFKFRIV